MSGRARDHIHRGDSFGARAADTIANAMGSWTFILLQSAIIVVWIAVNLILVWRHFDPYPFILLNLLFSTQAAYAAPIIMMSQNRQAYKDHLRDDHEADEVDLLFKINQQQLEILHLLRAKLYPDAPLHAGAEAALQKEIARIEQSADQLEAALGVDPG